ncbi:hypothetical protein D3C81_1812800 [compost metagenome]
MRCSSAIKPCAAETLCTSAKSPPATRCRASRASAGSPPSSARSVRTITHSKTAATAAANKASAADHHCMRCAALRVAWCDASAPSRATCSCCNNALRSLRQAGVSCALSAAAAASLSCPASMTTLSCSSDRALRSACMLPTAASMGVPCTRWRTSP